MKGTFSSQIKRKIERINENIMKDLNFNILTLVTILAASGSQKKLNSAAKNWRIPNAEIEPPIRLINPTFSVIELSIW